MLDDLINAEVTRFTNAIKALLADAVNAFNNPSPQTAEEAFPSAGTDPGPTVVPEPAPPAPPAAVESPQTVEEPPAPENPAPAPAEPSTLGGVPEPPA